MPSWNPFSRGRSPRAARERLASARALAASTRDDDDIKALMRVCDVHCIPTANNPASGRAVVDYLAGVAARRADDIASGAATAASLIARRAAAPDSDVVARYKADQQKVIAAASA